MVIVSWWQVVAVLSALQCEYNSDKSTKRQVLLLRSLVSKRGIQGTEKLSQLPMVTQLETAELRFKATNSGFRICASGYTPASQIRHRELQWPAILKIGQLLLMSQFSPSLLHLPKIYTPWIPQILTTYQQRRQMCLSSVLIRIQSLLKHERKVRIELKSHRKPTWKKGESIGCLSISGVLWQLHHHCCLSPPPLYSYPSPGAQPGERNTFPVRPLDINRF